MSVQKITKDLFFIERVYLNANHLVYRDENPVPIPEFPSWRNRFGRCSDERNSVLPVFMGFDASGNWYPVSSAVKVYKEPLFIKKTPRIG